MADALTDGSTAQRHLECGADLRGVKVVIDAGESGVGAVPQLREGGAASLDGLSRERESLRVRSANATAGLLVARARVTI